MKYRDGLLAYRKRPVISHKDIVGPSGLATRVSQTLNYRLIS